MISYTSLGSELSSIGIPSLFKHAVRYNIDIDTNSNQALEQRTKSLKIGDDLLQLIRQHVWGELSLEDSTVDEINFNRSGRIRYGTRVLADLYYYTSSDE